MFGEDWNKYFQYKYGSKNVNWETRSVIKNCYGKSIHNKKETDLFLHDEFYDKNLPRQVSPGTKYLPKYDEFGNVKQIKMYDDYGREIGWVDFTNHGYGNIDSLDYHTVPHWHERVYDALNPDGMA